MFKKVSFLLMSMLVLSSCSSKYYKNKKNPTKVTYRGQKPTSQVEKKTKAIIDSKLSSYENAEEDYHEIPPAVEVTTAVTEKYIESYKEISMVEMQRYKIPASITLAQAILESGSGQGRLARHGNNHFGIKCHSAWKGKTLTHDDDEKGECFRRYKYAYESFEDHSAFLVNRSRYASLFELDPDDYVAWAHGLKKAGYATDPDYAKKLIFLIKRYKLYQYDEQVLKSKNDESQVATKVTVKELPVKASQSSPTQAQVTINTAINSATKSDTTTKTISEKEKQLISNPLPTYYVVKSGDTLYKIAREQKVPIEQLIKLNNLNEQSSNNIYTGQELRIN